MASTYLTTTELSDRIKYDARTIRDRMKDSVLLEGVSLFPSIRGAENPLYLGTD